MQKQDKRIKDKIFAWGLQDHNNLKEFSVRLIIRQEMGEIRRKDHHKWRRYILRCGLA